MNVLTAGSKAYIDCFSGLVACRVLAVGSTGINVEVTARKAKAYRQGERLYGVSKLRVVPRDAVHVRNGQYRIRPYSVGEVS